MSKNTFGTIAVTGLNVGEASHLIADHELVESTNGWTEEEGAWTPANGPKTLYSGYSAISCITRGRISGTDYLVWADGNTIYRNGVNVGTITAGSDMSAISIDDGCVFIGGSKPYIYKGGWVRELGGPQLDEISFTGIRLADATSETITSVSAASSAVVTTANSLATPVGQYIYITGVSGMSDINGRTYMVTAISGSGPYLYTIDLDTSGYSAPGTGGTGYGTSCGLTGDYKYYIVPFIFYGTGERVYGRPRGLRRDGFASTLGAGDSWEADTITLSVSDSPNIKARFLWLDGGTAVYETSGVRGTDYYPGLQLYRTKADGSDFYLEKEWVHGDSDFTFTSATDDYYSIDTYFGGPQDNDLGAVWDADNYGRYRPPVGSIAAAVGRRLYIADDEKLYWSSLDSVDDWSELDFVSMPENVTGLGRVSDKVAIFGPDRIWVMDHSTSIPYIREIDTPVGDTNNVNMTTDSGILFLREDGLWLFDGARVSCVSRRAFSNITGPAAIASSGDTIFMCGSADAYTVRIRDHGWVWHKGEHYTLATSGGGLIYATDGEDVYELYSGSAAGGSIKTKLFGSLLEGKAVRVSVDVYGAGTASVIVNGNKQTDTSAHLDSSGDTGRRIQRYSIPRLQNAYLQLQITAGSGTKIHGYWVEVEQ